MPRLEQIQVGIEGAEDVVVARLAVPDAVVCHVYLQ